MDSSNDKSYSEIEKSIQKLLKENQSSKAIELINNLLEENSDCRELLLLKSDIYRARNEISNSITICKNLIKSKPEKFLIYSRLIDDLIELNNLEEAQKYILSYLSNFPSNISALKCAVKVFSKASMDEKSLYYSLALIRYHPDSHFGYMFAANRLKTKNWFIEAEEIVNEAIKKFPEKISFLRIKSEIHRKANQISKSLEISKQIIKRDPKNFKGFVRAAQDMMELGMLDESKKLIESYLIKEPNNVEVLKCAILVFKKSDETKKALDYAQKIIDVSPIDHRGYETKANLLMKLNKFDEAQSTIKIGIKNIENIAKLYLHSMNADLIDDDHNKSLNDALVMLNDPNSQALGFALSIMCYAKLGKYREASDTLEKALNKYPDDKHINRAAAYIYQKKDDQDKVKKYIDKFTLLSKRIEKEKAVIENQDKNNIKQIKSLFNEEEEAFFTNVGGVSNFKSGQHTQRNEHIVGIVLKILDYFKLEYYLHAGSLIGYVRDKKHPCWDDDFDVLIFDDQVDLFNKEVRPFLKKLGFIITGRVDKGYQIKLEKDDPIINYNENYKITVPHFHFDIFITSVDSLGYAKNKCAWGVYTRKYVPEEWIKPGTFIDMYGTKCRVFSEYEKDIFHEYGDIMNEVVVRNHITRSAIKLKNIKWIDFKKHFNNLYTTIPKKYPSSISQNNLDSFNPIIHKHIDDSLLYNFDQICNKILIDKPEKLTIKKDENLLWVMDIKRLFPKLRLEAELSNILNISRVILFTDYWDKIIDKTKEPEIEFDIILKDLKIVNSN